MKKNVAGQKIGAQMVTATDGSAFTSAVTVYVTGDAGTQAIGSVGSGACTHEGNGYHTYAPAQAETNYDLTAFTFIGTGAVPVTLQVFNAFPQTGDNFARLGAPVGASFSADVAAVKVDTTAIALKAASLTFTVAGQIDSNVIDWKGATAPAMTGDAFARLGVAGAGLTALGDTRIANLDAAVSTRSTYAGGAVASVTGAVGSVVAGVALTSGERASVADAILDRDMSTGTDSGSPTVRTVRQALRALRNKWTNAAGTYTVFKEDDATASWTGSVGTDAAAVPVVSNDPA
jgi:hypothetical protein